jgi:hypothetical protein
MMATNCLEIGAEPTHEGHCTSNTPQTLDNVQQAETVVYQPLPQSFIE